MSSQVRVVRLSTTATLFDDARDGVQVRCYSNIRLISCLSDLDHFSPPQRPGPRH